MDRAYNSNGPYLVCMMLTPDTISRHIIVQNPHGGFMHADQVEASWDAGKNKWLLRIWIGEEVIRRYCDVPKDAQEQVLKSVVQKTLQAEGYEPEPRELKIRS